MKLRDVPSGTAISVSADRRRYGHIYISILYVRTNAKETPPGGSINQRLIKLKQGQKTAFPFPLMVSPCLEKGKHSSLPYTPIPIRFLSPNILLAAVTEPRSSICTRFYSHVYGLCFTPFFYLWFLCQSESNFINVFFHRRASHLRFGFKIVSNIIA